MKFIQENLKLLLISTGIVACFVFLNSFSSGEPTKQSGRTIEVTGSAEMSLKPDKIRLQVQLRFNGKNRETQEAKLFKILKKNGIDEKEVEYNSYSHHTGWYYDWYYYYHHYWYYSNNYYQTYSIPVSSEVDPKKLFAELKKPLIYNLSIKNDGFHDLQAQRKKVKIEAIKAAKEKANYLLEAVEEKLGYVVSIKEVEPKDKQTHINPYWGYQYNSPSSLSASSSNSVVSSNQNTNNTVKGSPTDKLRYEVKVTFTIK